VRYTCVHYLDDFLRALLKACQTPDNNGVRVVKMYPDLGKANIVMCEVEAPTEEAFLCWVSDVNAKSKQESVHLIDKPEASQRCT